MLVSLTLLRSLLFPNCSAAVCLSSGRLSLLPAASHRLAWHSSALFPSGPCKPLLARAPWLVAGSSERGALLSLSRLAPFGHVTFLFLTIPLPLASIAHAPLLGFFLPCWLLPGLWCHHVFLLSISQMFLFNITMCRALSDPVSLDLTWVSVFTLAALAHCVVPAHPAVDCRPLSTGVVALVLLPSTTRASTEWEKESYPCGTFQLWAVKSECQGEERKYGGHSE